MTRERVSVQDASPGRACRPAPAEARPLPEQPKAGHEMHAVAVRRAPAVQARLAVGPADHPLEREADRVAEQVTGMKQRGPSRRTRPHGGTEVAPPIVHEVLASPGVPLEAGIRAFFEPRLRSDLSGVRVHRDGRAGASARAVDALAYAVGSDIVFADGSYAPGTAAGRSLLAHELAHVLQTRTTARAAALVQRQSPVPPAQDAGGGQRLDELAQRLSVRASEMMGLWVDATQGALFSLPAPSLGDAVAEQNFYVALLGNMLWAATSLMPEWDPVMIPMSVGGGLLAGGAAAQSPPAQPPSQLAPLIHEILACRDRMVAGVRLRAQQIAQEMDAMGLTDPEQQDRELWRRLFGNLEYDSSVALLEHQQQILKKALDAYAAQYRDWQSATEAEASRRLDAMGHFDIVAPGMVPAQLGLATAFPALVKQVRRENPWDPEAFDPHSLKLLFRTPTAITVGRDLPEPTTPQLQSP